MENIPFLIEHGADIYAYDLVGEDNFKKRFPDNITYIATPQEALEGANVCFVFTECGEIKSVTPAEYRKLIMTPLVYDGRNLYDTDEMKRCGVEYYSIGR